MNKPKCPYCGGEMDYYFDDNPMLPEGYYYCKCCGSCAPTATTEKAAYVGAMDRFPQGRWEEGNYVGEIGYESEWFCSECGYVVLSEDYPENWHFCPNCGAEMRKEANDER